MLLVFDIGNTNITIGCFSGDALRFTSRMYSAAEKSSDEFAVSLLNIFKIHKTAVADIDGAIISSVVPALTGSISAAVTTLTGNPPLIVGAACHGSFLVEVLPVEQIGADLICASVAAKAQYPLPCIIADLGTATKLIVLDEIGCFLGCSIAPGMKISTEALTRGAALLPAIPFAVPQKAIGSNTVECMQSGVVFGTAAMLDGMVERMMRELGRTDVSLVATGGYSKGVLPCCKSKFAYDEHLLLKGLRQIYLHAQGA